ncbi:MAG TPA: amidohydrolase family protein, partial [Leifsonia sp.]|nr:amidohydrolase family protein [Leifsonia sp.]
RAGVRLAFGSDAPVAPLDPWIAMAAAVARTRGGREPWHPEQAVARRVALASSVRSGLEVGDPADLAVLDEDPFGCGLAVLRTMPVAATLLAGTFTHDTLR